MPKKISSRDPIENKDWGISVCGLNCALCKTAAKGDCQGCKKFLDQQSGPDCIILICARDKGHRYCFQCNEFPCEKLNTFAADGHDHHRITVENLKKMKELGLEKWITEQQKPMFCPGWFF